MKRIPKIRLKGFEGEWNSSVLSDIASFSKGHGYSKNDLTQKKGAVPIILYGRMYTKYESIIKDVDTFVHPQPNSVYSEGDEVIVPGSGETAEDISIASAVAKKGIILGGDLNIIKPNKCLYSPFIALNITNSQAHYVLSTKAQGKTIVHLHNEDFKDVEINYPSLAEQQSIGSFFSSFDRLSTGHQQRLENLRRVKKSMLQKMFPQQGQTVPEIRFKGFEGEWEKAKLSTFLTVSDEVNSDNFYGIEDVLSVSGDYGVVNQIEFQGRSFAGASVAGYGIAETGDVIYTKSPLKSNPYGIIKTNKGKPGIVSVLYGVYHPIRERTDSSFVQTYFESDARLNNYLRTLINKGSKNTLLISDEDALNGSVCFPSYKEQQQITSFFTSIDNLINEEVKYIDQLNRVKRTLLQKMFV